MGVGNTLGKGERYAAAIHYLLRSDKSWLLVLDNVDDLNLDLTNYLSVERSILSRSISSPNIG
jgi:hypothetical protein